MTATFNAREKNTAYKFAQCTKIIKVYPKAAEAVRAINPSGTIQDQKGDDEQDKFIVNIEQIWKFVVGVEDRVCHVRSMRR